MPISKSIVESLERGSWVRRAFQEGARLKKERGAENVFDYTLGNPEVEPPEQVLEALRRVVANAPPGSHGYMPNAGYVEVRDAVARQLRKDTGLEYTAEHIIMTVGSAGACNVILKSVLDPGDEVIVLAPYFPEYAFYIGNHSGRMVRVETDETFLPDADRIAAAITPRTKAILLNTPNNPTGRIYPASVLQKLEAVLAAAGHPIVVVSDEPYKHIVYDGRRQPEVASCLTNTVICTSWSKSQAIPGERIGYLALSPRLPDLSLFQAACGFSNRTLGFVNAPALWQRVVAEAPDALVDISPYQEKRDLLCDALANIGYRFIKPEGSYYIFAETPIADDVAFVRMLAAEGVLTVPGIGFGRSGYMRLSLTIELEKVKRSIAGFEKVFRQAGSEVGAREASGR